MSCENEDKTLKQFERNKYFYGKLMTVKDFETEQNYFNGKRKLLNQFIHGIGIVCGLEVEASKTEDNKLKVKISPGVALDCCGNEIVVGSEYEERFDFNGEKNCIYIKYNECEKDPCPVLSNVSNCKESCCLSRYEECFTLELGYLPDKNKNTVSGKVTKPPGDPIIGAWVEALDKNEVVKDIAVTDKNGDYTLILNSGEYKIRASAYINGMLWLNNNYRTLKNIDHDMPLPLSIDEGIPKDAKELWEKLSDESYENYLKSCPQCNDAKIFLAVINEDGSGLDTDKATKYRSIVYNNPLLYDIITEHMVNFNNPHGTTAKQVGALKGLTAKNASDQFENIGNVGGFIKIEASNGIKVVGSQGADPKITISSTGGTSAPVDVPQPATGPTDTVTSVGTDAQKTVGSAIPIKFARADHKHNLDVSAFAATDDNIVTSVGNGSKTVGSKNPIMFAREDHMHNLDSSIITQLDFLSQSLCQRALVNTYNAFKGLIWRLDFQGNQCTVCHINDILDLAKTHLDEQSYDERSFMDMMTSTCQEYNYNSPEVKQLVSLKPKDVPNKIAEEMRPKLGNIGAQLPSDASIMIAEPNILFISGNAEKSITNVAGAKRTNKPVSKGIKVIGNRPVTVTFPDNVPDSIEDIEDHLDDIVTVCYLGIYQLENDLKTHLEPIIKDPNSFSEYVDAVDELKRVIDNENYLEIAIAQDRVCFYASLLE